MRIDKLELYGYKRLMLKNIVHLEYTPTSPYQLILGTNGSGKSSILAELSPLPGHSSNFSKDGFKKIWITHGGAQYLLTSTMKSGKHSFLFNDEELNPGGTQEVQKTLVQQHFKITKEIHELLTGEIRLTDMSPAERRKWITMISTYDYTYAMSVFKRVAARARDMQGAVKHQKSRLADELQNLQRLESETDLDERAAKLREELNQLMLERVPNLKSYSTYRTQLETALAEIENISKGFHRQLAYVPVGKRYESIEDANMDLANLNGAINGNNLLLQRLSSEYSDLEQVAASLTLSDDVGDPEHLIDEIDQEIESLSNSLKTYPVSPTGNLAEVVADNNAVLDTAQVCFSELPDNTDRVFTRERLQNAVQDRKVCQSIVDGLESRVRHLESRKRIMSEARETKCPSCNYIWRDGWSDSEMNTILSEIQAANNDIATNNDQIKALNVYIEECEDATSRYAHFRNFVTSYPRLQPLWDYLIENKYHLDNPKLHTPVFTAWDAACRIALRIHDLRARRSEIRAVLELRQASGDTSQFALRMVRLQREIDDATAVIHRINADKRNVTNFIARYEKMRACADEVEELYQKIVSMEGHLIDAVRNDTIDEAVESHQLELGTILRKISEKEGQRGIVEDIRASLGRAEDDARALSLIANALSPSGGLIAEQLAGDVGCLVAQLNAIIGSIWTYGMTILPCGLDGGELDYRFPVQFESAGHESSDIRRTSKGQRQIIDLAFHLTVMLYLDLRDYPLFLDEPGEGFDEQHRIALMAFVRQLMDANQHSQLFMVSHYASSHGSFVNAEVLVLDDRNITVPGTYNQHVRLQ